MALDRSLVYRRTERGVREVYEKSYQFTQSERLILILVDGRLDLAGLKARLPSVNDERLARALSKLTEAGLIEPSRAASPGSALQPDAVAQFLEQTDLDPVTVIGGGADMALEEAFAVSDSATRPSSRPTQPVRSRSGEALMRSSSSGSGRSHEAKSAWGGTRATDFAITTINVPDRLDLQEVRAREDEDDFRPRRRLLPDSYTVGVWFKRLLLMGLLGGAGYWAVQSIEPIRDEMAPERIAQRLTSAFGQPVAIADTQWRFTPRPRLALVGVSLPGGIRLDEVALHINWRDAISAARGGQVVWAEAAVPSLTLRADQALGLIELAGRGAAALPSGISTLRFESVRFADVPLLPGHYQAIVRRGGDGQMGPLLLTELDIDGTLQLRLVSSLGDTGNQGADFQLEATRWRVPFGPQIEWSDVSAKGRVEHNLVVIDEFNLGGFYGAVQGVGAAGRDIEWATTGAVRASNIDIEAMLRALKGKRSAEGSEGEAKVPMNGTALFELTAFGHGDTLDAALHGGTLSGPVQVRWGVLNGINLGFAATQGTSASGGLGGGVTRFTELSAQLDADSSGITLRNLNGRAGAMSTRGELTVRPDMALTGALRVDLGASRVQAPLNLRVRGTVLSPQFGR